ncbi:MAG: dephospho-CoA kinase, partial [Gallionella sp.]|nr:dephospho-CoA kinase [Gallionella sp.]
MSQPPLTSKPASSSAPPPVPCIGLTGGIGSGKSTVGRLFEALGACIIDTDAISHQLSGTQGAAIAEIRAAFGAAFITPDGALDRSKMRQLIFSDVNAKTRLQHILHPMIFAISQAQLAQCNHAPYAILMVPLLLENPAYLPLVQRVLVVDCSESQQIERVMRRSQLGEAEIRAILTHQISRDGRLAKADDVIRNEGTPEALEKQVFM